MIADITKLENQTYQHKRNTIGDIVQGIYDIKQCIDTIISTTKGEVPFMPELGTNVIEAVGENMEMAEDIAVAIFSKEIPLQEPRAEIIDISSEKNDNGRLLVKVHFKEKATNLTEKTERYV